MFDFKNKKSNNATVGMCARSILQNQYGTCCRLDRINICDNHNSVHRKWCDLFKMNETIKQSRWISNYKKILSHTLASYEIRSPRKVADFGKLHAENRFRIESDYITRWPTDSHLLNTLWTHERSQTRTNLLHLHTHSMAVIFIMGFEWI